MTDSYEFSSNWLAFIYDEQSLEDLLQSSFPRENIILLCPLSLEKNCSSLKASFYKTIYAKDYLNTGEITSLAYKLYEQIPYKGIIAPHEIDILRAADMRQLLGLSGQLPDSARAFRQKTAMKKTLQQLGVLVPHFQPLNSPTDLLDFMKKNSFPIVVKPDFGTGSQGVIILRNKEEVTTYLENGPNFQGDIHEDLQAEVYVEGTMYHINGFFGESDVIYSWPCIYPQQSIEMLSGNPASSYTLQASNPLVERLNTYAKNILKILPTPPHTPFHLEIFLTPKDEIVFCEIACRIGGKGVRQAWTESLGISLSSLYYHGILQQQNKIKRGISPTILSGEIWFPVKQGKLKHIEETCPFPWVKDYRIFYRGGDLINAELNNINDCLCGSPLLVAQTEGEMLERLGELKDWVQRTTQWEG